MKKNFCIRSEYRNGEKHCDFIAGVDGREQSSNHGLEPEGCHHGPIVRLVRPDLARVVGRNTRCQLSSLRFVSGFAFFICYLTEFDRN